MTRRSVAYRRTEYNGQQVAGETNDCAVRALMTVTGSTYLQAHTMLRTQCGRRNLEGHVLAVAARPAGRQDRQRRRRHGLHV